MFLNSDVRRAMGLVAAAPLEKQVGEDDRDTDGTSLSKAPRRHERSSSKPPV